jgi:hypothetical protein
MAALEQGHRIQISDTRARTALVNPFACRTVPISAFRPLA